jgi:thiol-disulfide isomerase/thioredoxin
MNANNPLVRLAAAGAIIGLAVLALWQAGILFQSNSETIDTPDGTAKLFAAMTDVDTPPVDGRSVGLNEGDIAPDFEFSTFDGQRMKLSDLRGRPVFLNFWASWCGPCRQEMPNMQTMLDKYGSSSNLAVLAVNNGESLGPAQRFLGRIEVQLTEYGYDPTAQIVKKYQVTGLPVSYFIDSDGVITRVVTGELSFNVMETSVQEVIAGYKAMAP